jgi:hypothetical protein
MSLERHAEDVALSGAGSRAPAPVRYLYALIGGAIAALACFCAFYTGLYATGYLPPPPLSNNVCTDEKLVFLRNNVPSDPNFLVLGSSVAWRNIDSAVIAQKMPGARPLNGGFCGMQIHQSAFIAGWMIEHWPSIQRVLLVVSPLDYTSCKATGQVFDPVDTRRFVFEGTPVWSFYVRYFDPISLTRNIERQMRDREQERILKVDRSFTRYGDGPLDTNENRGLFYGPMPVPDPECFAALRQLASDLTEQGRTLMVVATPIHPDWKLRYDPHGAFEDRFWEDISNALQGTGAHAWSADNAGILDQSAFTDAVHVRWSSAATLTNAILERFPSR